MATDEARLLVRLEAQVRSFEREMQRADRSAQRAVTSIQSRFKGLDRQMAVIGAGFARSLAAGLGAGVGIAAISQLPQAIRGIVEEAGGLVDAANKIGITTDALQELQFQATQTGGSAEGMITILDQFSRRIGDAATGGGQLADTLAANGVALRDAEGNIRPLIDLLADYADLIAGAASDQERLTLAVDAFGRGGDEAAIIFERGAQAIAGFRDEAHRWGAVMDQQMLVKIEQIDDEWAKLERTISINVRSAILSLVGAIDQVGEASRNLRNLLPSFLTQPSAGLIQAGQFLQAQRNSRIQLESTEAARRALAAGQGAVPGAGDIFTAADLMRERARTIIPDTGAASARDAAAAAAEREKQRLDELIVSLEEELRLVGASEEEQRLSAELRAAGADATAEYTDRIRELVPQLVAAQEAHALLVEQMDQFRDVTGGALSAFNQSLREGASLGDSLRSSLERVLDMVIQIAEQQAIAALFGAPGTTGGGTFGSAIASLFGGFRQHGGPVSPGSAYVVGERGPELFMPHVPGRIAAGQQAAQVQIQVGASEYFDVRVASVAGPIAVSAVKSNNRTIPGMLVDRQARGTV